MWVYEKIDLDDSFDLKFQKPIVRCICHEYLLFCRELTHVFARPITIPISFSPSFLI